jgi:hypothetical protein
MLVETSIPRVSLYIPYHGIPTVQLCRFRLGIVLCGRRDRH